MECNHQTSSTPHMEIGLPVKLGRSSSRERCEQRCMHLYGFYGHGSKFAAVTGGLKCRPRGPSLGRLTGLVTGKPGPSYGDQITIYIYYNVTPKSNKRTSFKRHQCHRQLHLRCSAGAYSGAIAAYPSSISRSQSDILAPAASKSVESVMIRC